MPELQPILNSEAVEVAIGPLQIPRAKQCPLNRAGLTENRNGEHNRPKYKLPAEGYCRNKDQDRVASGEAKLIWHGAATGPRPA